MTSWTPRNNSQTVSSKSAPQSLTIILLRDQLVRFSPWWNHLKAFPLSSLGPVSTTRMTMSRLWIASELPRRLLEDLWKPQASILAFTKRPEPSSKTWSRTTKEFPLTFLTWPLLTDHKKTKLPSKRKWKSKKSCKLPITQRSSLKPQLRMNSPFISEANMTIWKMRVSFNKELTEDLYSSLAFWVKKKKMRLSI